MKSKLFQLFTVAWLSCQADAQIRIEQTFSVGSSIPDRGQFMDVRTLTSTGLSSILDVDVSLSLSGATGTRMRLGDLYATLTYGTASEEERVSVLLNRAGASNVTPWGSSLSSLNVTFDDSGIAPNIYGATTGAGSYIADGRLSVNPFSSPAAYDSADVTAGLSALNGDLLASNTWSLLVADVRQGAQAKLDSWTLVLTGSAVESGQMNLGAGGRISDIAGSESNAVSATLLIGGTGHSGVTADVSQNLSLSGGLSGSGDLNKTGSGRLTLDSSSSGFSGRVVVFGGELKILSAAALGSNGRVSLASDGATLNLGNSVNLSNSITLGSAEEVARLDGGGNLSGNITGDGGLEKIGTGTMSLSGDSNYGGPTRVLGGALSIDGTLSGNGDLFVAEGATLMGSGTINVSTLIDGSHSVGNSPGLQTFTQGLSYSATSFLNWEFIGNDLGLRGVDYDAIDVTGGSLTIALGAVLNLLAGPTVDYSADPWKMNRSFTVIQFSGVGTSTGLFSLNTTMAGTSEDYGSWDIASEENHVVLKWIAVPEPGVMSLLGGMAAFLLLKRRREA
jgi:autotransporter-associated beta strand protein